MENIEKCEHQIGVLWNYESTKIATIKDLKEHIEWEKKWRQCSYGVVFHSELYSLSDYCDKRKNTDLHRFEYCPVCGKKDRLESNKGCCEWLI